MTESAEARYELGSDETELARLELQGRALAPATRSILVEAGIRTGMRVLDLGSGAGDVTFVAGELVGPEGSVTGLDRSPEALTRARARADQRGLMNVEFQEGDINEPAPGGPFDAITGRLILMYVPDPAVVLKQQATVLRTGGLLIPIEFDITTAQAFPPTRLVRQVSGWVAETFRRSGIHTSLGRQLWKVLIEAGLRPRGMIGSQPHFGPTDPGGAALLSGVARTVMPLMERTGVATADEVNPETLFERLSRELVANRAVFAHPMLLSAWGTNE
jgi:ubiquinone/menaquinone biosynthesis C-methylase UbiE